MGAAGNEDEWNHWVNKEFPDFKIIRELRNGSKHFEADDAVSRTIEPKNLMAYNKGLLGYNTRGIFVQLAAGRIVSVFDLVVRSHDWWLDLFKQFPRLA